jgi:hypothetical protein
VAWGALLEQGEQVLESRCRESGAPRRAKGSPEAGGGDGEAEAQGAAVGHEDVAGALRELTDGEDGEPPPVERMGGVGYLDLFLTRRWWVLERGIMLSDRSTRSTMAISGSSSSDGYAMV